MKKQHTISSTKPFQAGSRAVQPAPELFQLSSITELQVSTNNLLNWLLQKKSLCLENEPTHVLDVFRQQITAALRQYPVSTAPPTTIKFDQFIAPNTPHYAPIRALMHNLKSLNDDLRAAIVFSSVATGDTVRYWSDVDILAVVADEVLADSNRFSSVRQALVSLEDHLTMLDPWQHHGIQFITESDLTFYPETFLPLVSLAEGKSLLQPTTLSFHRRDSRAEQETHFFGIAQLMKQAAETKELNHHCRDGVCLQDSFAKADDNFYQLKYFVSVMALVPSLFIGLVDAPIKKRDSFVKIREYFSIEELELIQSCEAVRLCCDTVKPLQNEIPPEVQQALGPNYFTRAAKLMETLVRAYERHQSTTTQNT